MKRNRLMGTSLIVTTLLVGTCRAYLDLMPLYNELAIVPADPMTALYEVMAITPANFSVTRVGPQDITAYSEFGRNKSTNFTLDLYHSEPFEDQPFAKWEMVFPVSGEPNCFSKFLKQHPNGGMHHVVAWFRNESLSYWERHAKLIEAGATLECYIETGHGASYTGFYSVGGEGKHGGGGFLLEIYELVDPENFPKPYARIINQRG